MTETRLRTYRDPDDATGRIRRIRGRRAREQPEAEPERKEKPVTLYMLDFNQTTKEYVLTRETTVFSELPPGAVHVTGEKRAYFWDRCPHREPSDGITASDLYLYMVNNSINDALAYRYETSSIDMRKVITYGIAGVVLVCVVWALM